MNQAAISPERTCPSCKSRFAWAGRQWLVADPEGRTSYAGVKRDRPEPEPEILRCPACHALLSPGKATVEEEK